MCNISGERANVANLRPTDHAAANGQAGTVLNDECVPDDLAVRDAAAYDDYCRKCWTQARPLTAKETHVPDSSSASESSSTNAELE